MRFRIRLEQWALRSDDETDKRQAGELWFLVLGLLFGHVSPSWHVSLTLIVVSLVLSVIALVRVIIREAIHYGHASTFRSRL